MKNELLWAKTNSEAIVPTKRDEDAGYDLYACIDDYLVIYPGETKFVGLGIASAFPESYVMFLKERGSTAKYGLSLRSGVIDSGYRGEYIAAVSNVSENPVVIYNDSRLVEDLDCCDRILLTSQEKREDGVPIEKYYLGIELKEGKHQIYPTSKAICQGVLLSLPKLESHEVLYEQLKTIESERGTGLMGSSGK